MDYQKAIEKILDHLEDDKVDRAVMGCLRVARHAKDYVNAAIFMRELFPERQEVGRLIFEDMPHLKEEAQKFVFKTSLDRWLEVHTLEYNLGGADEGEERNVLKIGAGEIDAELTQWEQTISDMSLPAGMDPFDIAAFADRDKRQKAEIRLRIKALQTIKARIRTRCLNYAIQVEKQLALQSQQQGIVETLQNDVNNYFKARSDTVYSRLQKAAALASSKEAEDFSLLLTEVRRSLHGVADFFYPATSGKTVCSDGVERSLGKEQFLNRLHEFVRTQVRQSASRELLASELEHLAAFVRRLNDLASKGVHADVSYNEARQGLIGLYFFLSNLIQHLTQKSELIDQDMTEISQS